MNDDDVRLFVKDNVSEAVVSSHFYQVNGTTCEVTELLFSLMNSFMV